MGNKKKQPAKPTKDHNPSDPFGSNDQTLHQSNIQSTDLIHIKQEPDIKQETVVVGELIDVPALTYRSVEGVADSSEHGADYDFNELSFDEVKVEMKSKCDEKKEEQPKTYFDLEAEAADSQQDQQPSPQDEESFILPDSDNNARNIRKRGGQTHGNLTKKHNCNFCEYSTQYKHNLDQHVLKHTGEKPHECKFCPKRFTSKRSLHAHMKVHVKGFLFCCSGCLQGFNVKDEKNEHEIICKLRRYECHLCKESFGSMKTNMIGHMRMHSGNKPFECKECFKQFTQKSSLNEHMKLHAGPRLFRCSKCLERFSQQEERNLHEEKCNRRVYECYDCHKSFGLNKSHLIRHMLTHSDDKPFQCKQCPKKYTTEINLVMHTKKIHTKKLPFICLVCRQRFLKQTQCKAHQKNCNRRVYECHLCKIFFVSIKTHLEAHMCTTHSGQKPFQCKLCQIKFTRKVSLMAHMNRFHNKKQ